MGRCSVLGVVVACGGAMSRTGESQVEQCQPSRGSSGKNFSGGTRSAFVSHMVLCLEVHPSSALGPTSLDIPMGIMGPVGTVRQ